MEIRPDEIVKTREIPYDLFIHGIKAVETRRGFVRKLKKVLCLIFKPYSCWHPRTYRETKKDGIYTHRNGVKPSFYDAELRQIFSDKRSTF